MKNLRTASAAIAWWAATFEAPSTREIDLVRRPKETRCSGTKSRPCSHGKAHATKRGEYVCGKCGKPWPTEKVGSGGAVRRLASSRSHDRALDAVTVRRAFDTLTERQRLVVFAWQVAPNRPGWTRAEAVDAHLRERFPRRVWGVREVCRLLREGMARVQNELDGGMV